MRHDSRPGAGSGHVKVLIPLEKDQPKRHTSCLTCGLRVELEGQLANPGAKLNALLSGLRRGVATARRDPMVPRRHVQRQLSTAERLGPVRVRQLLSDYQGGMSIKDVAARYETSKASVLKILKEHDVATRPTGVNAVWLEEKHYRRAARKRTDR